jgi:methyl-accepting chemotaxis protein
MLQTVRDILLLGMTLAVIAVCVIAVVLILSLYAPLKNTASNLESASESAVVSANNLIAVTDDLAVVVDTAQIAANDLSEITADMKNASDKITAVSEGMSTVSDRMSQASERVNTASQELARTAAETTESVQDVVDNIKGIGIFSEATSQGRWHPELPPQVGWQQVRDRVFDGVGLIAGTASQ